MPADMWVRLTARVLLMYGNAVLPGHIAFHTPYCLMPCLPCSALPAPSRRWQTPCLIRC
jgi:hypothetical protein